VSSEKADSSPNQSDPRDGPPLVTCFRAEFKPQWTIRTSRGVSILLVVILIPLTIVSLFVAVIRGGPSISLSAAMVAIMGALVFISWWEYRNWRSQMGRASSVPVALRARNLFRHDRTASFAGATHSTAIALARSGERNLVVLVNRAAELRDIRPLDVEFEPIPLDGTDPRWEQLYPRIASPKRVAEWRELLNPTTVWGDIYSFMRRHRNATQAIILIAIVATIAFEWGSMRGSASIYLATLGIIIAAQLVSSLGIFRGPSDGFVLVPGGILHRSGKRRDGDRPLRLYRRSECVLCLAGTRGGTIYVACARGDECMTQQIDSVAAEILLAAWLSPLEPPGESQIAALS